MAFKKKLHKFRPDDPVPEVLTHRTECIVRAESAGASSIERGVRQMRRRKKDPTSRTIKTSQTFFCLDADTCQPVAFTIGSSAKSVTQATPELLHLSQQILNIADGSTLVLADTEHYNARLFNHIIHQTPFEFMAPGPANKGLFKRMAD